MATTCQARSQSQCSATACGRNSEAIRRSSGRHLLLGGTDRTVVGVMPRGFWFPDPTTRVWLSRRLDAERRVGELTLIGRIAQG